MTTQLQDGLSYQGEVFDVREGLFSPDEHGLHPGNDSSACWRGWQAHYEIRDGQLLLTTLLLAQPMQFLEFDDAGNEISKPPRYPALNGVEAVRLSGHMDSSWAFEDVDLPLDYSGTLTLCRLPRHLDVPDYWEARDNPDLDDFEHVVQLTLDKGRVTGEVLVREPVDPVAEEDDLLLFAPVDIDALPEPDPIPSTAEERSLEDLFNDFLLPGDEDK